MANSHTLGTCFSPRMWWADIEVPNTAVDVTLGRYQPVIPGVPFIRWAMVLPLRTTGSLRPSFTGMSHYTPRLIAEQQTYYGFNYFLNTTSNCILNKFASFIFIFRISRCPFPYLWRHSSMTSKYVSRHISCIGCLMKENTVLNF